MKNIISYLLILMGGSIAIYANATEKQNVMLLIIGIVTLMIGIYGLNRKLSSKSVEASKTHNQEEEE